MASGEWWSSRAKVIIKRFGYWDTSHDMGLKLESNQTNFNIWAVPQLCI